ncbi:hypothetical protein PG997_014021 [Apiospora hydei]|uniref:Uncharacterized protein n=1 Tax=Apiospora hydei TaxID=1337664 RepID=A0ABR1V7V6_9PEZI
MASAKLLHISDKSPRRSGVVSAALQTMQETAVILGCFDFARSRLSSLKAARRDVSDIRDAAKYRAFASGGW